MNAVVSTVKLHLNKRRATFIVPLTIAGMVAVISILISLIFWRAGSIPGSTAWITGSQSNPGIVYSLAGFLIYLGVASVATTFPFALTLGATRRAFVVGTLIWEAITAAYIAVVFAALSGIELATHHWILGFYIFDIDVLGNGDIGRLLLIVFLGCLLSLTVGGVFAAAWVRFGAQGPRLIAFGLVVVLASSGILLIPELAAIIAAFQLWWLAVGAGALIVLSSVGTWLLLRSAIVR